MNNPYPAVFVGATRELRQVSLEAAIVSIDNLSKFILEVKRENDDEFWQSAPRPYGLSGSIAALLDVVKEVNWAEPPEPDAGDPDSEVEGPPTPRQPKGFADRAPRLGPRDPRESQDPEIEDVAMQPAGFAYT